MATRGARPQPTAVQIARGIITKDQVPVNEPMPVGPVEKVSELTEDQERMWDTHIAPLFWLTSADSYKAYMWCALAVKFSRKRGTISSAIIGQLRALGSELGMDPTSRRRLGTERGPNDSQSPEVKYFINNP